MSLWLCGSEIEQGQTGSMQELQMVFVLEMQKKMVERTTLQAAHICL